jgi:hypothetical protein
MNRERLVAQRCPCHINQMAMMRKDHDLPAVGESRQRAQDIRRAFIVRGDESEFSGGRRPSDGMTC